MVECRLTDALELHRDHATLMKGPVREKSISAAFVLSTPVV